MDLVTLVITIIVLGCVVGLLLWLLQQMPFIPPPFVQIARAIIIVVAVLVLIKILLGATGVHLAI